MAQFDQAFGKVIINEGGYTNDQDDLGGETKYGISKRSYPEVDIASLTLGQAAKIYKRDFWDPLRLDEIHDQAIAEEVFDSHVNTDRQVIKWLQQAFNLTNYWQGNNDIVVDGIIGSATIAAINSSPHPDRILKVLNGLQLGHYINIVEARPDQEKWFGGWLKRVWEN